MRKPTRHFAYLHTLEGRPAMFFPDEGEVLYPGRSVPLRTVPTLRQLRREQERSRATRIAAFGNDDFSYGYVRVEVPS